MKKGKAKHVSKVRDLIALQTNCALLVFKDIERLSKPVKKQQRLIYHSLKQKKLNIESNQFDLEQMLKRAAKY